MDVHERLALYLGRPPGTSAAAFVAPNATVLGAVTLGKDSSVWYGCVLRGDINTIEIGAGTNIQDLAMIHLADAHGVRIGRHTTVGHSAIIHACEIGDECLIGMGATIMDGAKIGDRCIVGARALVTQGFVAPSGSLVLGTPAKVVRTLTAEETAGLLRSAEKYIAVARAHAARSAGR